MDSRLEGFSKSLSTFLEDELSATHLGLSLGERAHLDRFRAFLQAYYVAKLGYYPPSPLPKTQATFSKTVLQSMTNEFGVLYEYLVDRSFSSSDLSASPAPAQGGICVLQSVQAFDKRHSHTSLKHPLPLIPLAADMPKPSTLSSRFSFRTSDKIRTEARRVTLAALSKATNAHNVDLLANPLVRAYQNFEKDCAFSAVKSERIEKASHTDARKVRWIMVYAMLQTLTAATAAPACVRERDSIPYHVAIDAAGCTPWPQSIPYPSLLRTQTETACPQPHPSASERLELRPDIDYTPQASPNQPLSRRSSILSTLSTLSYPDTLLHPVPRRLSHHEILVRGYGNDTNIVSIISAGNAASSPPHSIEDSSSCTTPSSATPTSPSDWSSSDASSATSVNDSFHDSISSCHQPLPLSISSTKPSDLTRKGSIISLGRRSLRDFLDNAKGFPLSFSVVSAVDNDLDLVPEPLRLGALGEEEECMCITQEIRVEYEDIDAGCQDRALGE